MFRSKNGKTFVGIASIPERVDSLKKAIDSIHDQATRVGVYLNNYDSVPGFLLKKNIIVRRSQDHGDLRDNGKFFFLQEAKEQYYATIDDDIIYPTDYIYRLIEALRTTGTHSAIGVHGSNFPGEIKAITEFRHVFHFERSLPFVTRVDLLGTGTLLFDQSVWKLQTNEFIDPGMADVWFALAAEKRDYPIFVINRNRGWLSRFAAKNSQTHNLYKETQRSQRKQVSLIEGAKLGGSLEKALSPLIQKQELRVKFSISHLLRLFDIGETLRWSSVSRKFSNQLLSGLESELLLGTQPEKLKTSYLSVIEDILEGNISIETLRTFSVWVSLAKGSDEPPKMEGMLFDCKPERVSRILKSLSSIICENWIIEGKEPNRSDLETILEFLSPEYLVPLSKLVKEPDTFPANIRIIYPGNDPIESASQLSGIVNTLHPMLRQKSEQFWTDLAYSSPGTLEIGLVSCVGLLHSGYSSKALGIFDYLLTKPGYSFDIVVLQHLISEYNKNTRSQTPSTLMDLLSNYFYLPSSARDSGDQIVRQFEKTPLVTVVMTARNPGDTALNSISHLLETSLIENLEIICIDDGSDLDFTPTINEINDSRVKSVRLDESINIYNARNLAIEMAEGEFVAFLDAGDFSMPGRLFLQAKELDQNPSLQAVTCLGIRFDALGNPILDNNARFLGNPPASLMLRREVFEEIGPFLPVPTRGDVEFIARTKAFYGDESVTCIQKPLYLADQPKNSTSFSPREIAKFKNATSSWHRLFMSDPYYIEEWLENRILPVPIPDFK